MPAPNRRVAAGLAAAFLAGEWDVPAMAARGREALAYKGRWVRDMALVAVHAYPSPPLDRPRELAELLVAAAGGRVPRNLTVRRWFVAPTAMGQRPWPVAPLDTVHDLQDLLGLTLGDLQWYADVKGLERSAGAEKLRHYRYRWAPKRSGGARLIEEPKPVLKHLQRVVLREILDHVPPHDAAHGFAPDGRSSVTFAAVHSRRLVVVHLDLEDFFGSVGAGRVYGVFRRCGYPEPVAHLLTGLVTNAAPPAVLEGAAGAQRRRLRAAHLPQGAPASPALANLVAYRLDRRLAGLAGAAGFTYSRYADDLAFSSETHRRPAEVARLVDAVTAIAKAEGFRVNPAKTSVRRSGQRQRLAGVVVNDRPNVDRREYDRLKAILHNAARFGPATQNRDGHADFRAHLRGRVAWVRHVHPERGARLLAAFDRIDWSE